MYWGNGMGGWGMVLMTASGLLFWGLISASIVLLFRSTGRSGQLGSVATPAPTPQQVLAERFARGQIDEDEYTRRLHVLGHAASARQSGG